eukprot:UN23473
MGDSLLRRTEFLKLLWYKDREEEAADSETNKIEQKRRPENGPKLVPETSSQTKKKTDRLKLFDHIQSFTGSELKQLLLTQILSSNKVPSDSVYNWIGGTTLTTEQMMNHRMIRLAQQTLQVLNFPLSVVELIVSFSRGALKSVTAKIIDVSSTYSSSYNMAQFNLGVGYFCSTAGQPQWITLQLSHKVHINKIEMMCIEGTPKKMQ